jgi:hypothetical protein
MASSECLDDNNQACQLQGIRRRPQLEEATAYQGVLGIVAPRKLAGKEEQTLEPITALDDFMTNLLQELRITPSETTILVDNACSNVRQDETLPRLNERSSAEDAFFDIETEDGELIQHLSSSDFVDTTTSQHEELSAKDFTVSAETSTSSVRMVQQSFHIIKGPDEEMCPGKDISPTGVMDHALLRPAPPILQKIKDQWFDLEEPERDIAFAHL